ncbi:UNVERIFIED_CONTAM: Transposon Ty3-I Gag-Pol polyprotein [Sesamum radiatum]|uniref:Transposon Ty3-I Gag-Pol polyprotein n=1 Tax=Sesamum radiatum TaxID=300843 RepID=A0AAW2R3J9_SESRA
MSSPILYPITRLHLCPFCSPSLRPLRSKLQFSDTHGVVLYDNRLYIPEQTGLRTLLLSEFHCSAVGGHSGTSATFNRLASSFYWPKMKSDVKAFVRCCLPCQHNKYSTDRPIGLLQPLPVPHQVWEDLSMDFITHLPPSGGRTVIWVVIDRLSKYAHFVGLPAKFTASSLAATFDVEIYRLRGMPQSIVSDRDPLFLSTFWGELFHLSGTTLAYSSAYHPQSDGQTEVLNRVLETYLCCFVRNPVSSFSFFIWQSFGTIPPITRRLECHHFRLSTADPHLLLPPMLLVPPMLLHWMRPFAGAIPSCLWLATTLLAPASG